MRVDTDVLIVGSGFASSLLARALSEMGRDVLLAERAQHPRFALGESTTPLGNLSLERLARRFGWRDVWNLANWGRFTREHPSLRCGLKRGFTFDEHRAGASSTGPHPPVMVAASPTDDVADTQWLRADVDAYLARAAVASGARLLERTKVESVEVGAGRVHAIARTDGGPSFEIGAHFLVDGSGSNGLLATALELPRKRDFPFETSLLFAHFENLAAAADNGASGLAGGALPYSPEHSAIHHLLDVGWMYELRFDKREEEPRQLASCGWVLDHARCKEHGLVLPLPGADVEAAELHAVLLERFPRLGRRFSLAQPTQPLQLVGPLQWRLEQAVGERFALLPQAVAFYDPMFSVGIAWSLLAVERLCDVLGRGPLAPDQAQLSRYQQLLLDEADHIEALLTGAYTVLTDVQKLGWYAQIYFAAASFTETQQRMLDANEVGWHWDGFLGARDPVIQRMVARGVSLARSRDVKGLADAIPSLIAERNVAGLADLKRHPLYSVNPETVVASAALLGLEPQEARARLPRLLGRGWSGEGA